MNNPKLSFKVFLSVGAVLASVAEGLKNLVSRFKL